eukprot:g10503.t1
MTVDEKLRFFHGENHTYVGWVSGVDRLGIPPIVMQDGPQGFRQPDFAPMATGSSTQFPCNLAVGATFDQRLAFYYGKFIAKEFRGKGANMLLGPGVNVNRIPVNGRNFEYLSGEDPTLGAEMAPRYVQGALTENTMTSVKHFIFNNQETQRMYYSAEVPQQVEMEYYMKPFIAGVEAGAGSVMCSYNRVINGTYACENPNTLKRLEKFSDRYFVMSDWGATHSGAKALKAGLAMEMPFAAYMSMEELKKALDDKSLPMKTVDGLVLRALKALKETGQLDGMYPGNTGSVYYNVTSPLQKMTATILAAESMILLWNQFRAGNSVVVATSKSGSSTSSLPLPLNPSTEKVETVGCGYPEMIVGGGGSGHVEPSHVVTVDEVLKKSGLLVEEGSGAPAADATLFCFSTYSAENGDRANLEVEGPKDQLKKMATSQASKGRKILVFVSTPGPFLLPVELGEADAILAGVFPGERTGEALAAVLYGRMSPNGKLPFALPNKENEQGMTEAQYPGTPTPDEFHLRTKYTENLSFGYRWYQQHNVQPKFHFGHGLSYGIADLYVTNVMWAREKNSVHFCVENRPGMGQLVDGMKKEAAKKISVLLAARSAQPADGLLSLGSGATSIRLLDNAVAKLQRKIAQEGPSALIYKQGSASDFELINLKEAAAAPVKVSVQFYVRHGDRKFMELLQFTALENVFPNEKSCSSVVFEPPQYWDVEGEVMSTADFEPPQYWDVEGEVMRHALVYDLFVSTNGIDAAQWVGTYNRKAISAEEPEVVFE